MVAGIESSIRSRHTITEAYEAVWRGSYSPQGRRRSACTAHPKRPCRPSSAPSSRIARIAKSASTPLVPASFLLRLPQFLGNDGRTNQTIRRHIADKTPLGRRGTLDEVAQAVSFLASDASSYVTGIELSVDGGMTQI
jgi:NAD(P)-dependent dehydrogenase (short-subunit alcohol dehydrogenase family)